MKIAIFFALMVLVSIGFSCALSYLIRHEQCQIPEFYEYVG